MLGTTIALVALGLDYVRGSHAPLVALFVGVAFFVNTINAVCLGGIVPLADDLRADVLPGHLTLRIFAGADGSYAVDHCANTYVVNKNGKLVATVPIGMPADEVAAIVRQHL